MQTGWPEPRALRCVTASTQLTSPPISLRPPCSIFLGSCGAEQLCNQQTQQTALLTRQQPSPARQRFSAASAGAASCPCMQHPMKPSFPVTRSCAPLQPASGDIELSHLSVQQPVLGPLHTAPPCKHAAGEKNQWPVAGRSLSTIFTASCCAMFDGCCISVCTSWVHLPQSPPAHSSDLRLGLRTRPCSSHVR